MKTDKDGRAKFYGLGQGLTYTFHASKSGYTSDSKNKKVPTNGASTGIDMFLAKLPASGKPAPADEVYVTRRYGVYAHADRVQRDRFNVKDPKDRPQLQVQNSESKGIEGVEVEWSWQMYNW